MMDLLSGWSIDVDRGPDWLFVRPHGNPPTCGAEGLAESLWGMLRQQLANRIVLELDDVPHLSSPLIGEMVKLGKRVYSNNGVVRICGLSDENWNVLKVMRLEGCFPYYADREAAVMGYRPTRPR